MEKQLNQNKRLNTEPVMICSFYRFIELNDYVSMRRPLLDFMKQREILGTVLLAEEGINASVAGRPDAIEALFSRLNTDARLKNLERAEAWSDMNPFYRAKVRLKKEIVTLGVEGVNPRLGGVVEVEPHGWNQLIADPDILLIDTRNEYEIGIGTFQNAVNPHTQTFREFPEYVKKHLNPLKHQRIAMCCTGGIRCEKSAAYLKEQGFEEVFRLKGGILKYLEKTPVRESKWKGECFVFDHRVSVDNGLKKGQYNMCFACRLPITGADKSSAYYVQGINCPHCRGKYSSEKRKRFEERERQIRLSRKRGEEHLGSAAARVMQKRKQTKKRKKEAALIKQRQCNGAPGA